MFSDIKYFMNDVVVRWLCDKWSGERSFDGWMRLANELHGARSYASALGHDGDAEMLADASALALARAAS